MLVHKLFNKDNGPIYQRPSKVNKPFFIEFLNFPQFSIEHTTNFDSLRHTETVIGNLSINVCQVLLNLEFDVRQHLYFMFVFKVVH